MPPALTDRFTAAVDYARLAHAGQTRKGSSIPYLSHLLGVASLVLDYGGSEEQVIAALLHDVIEDCGSQHEALIRAQFGTTVVDIVLGCTDGTAEGKAAHADAAARQQDWLLRKQRYLAHLAHAHEATLLVSGCDKLHNCRAIVIDQENPALGNAVFDRFTGGRDGSLMYYQLLADLFTQRGLPMATQLELSVRRMTALAGMPLVGGPLGRGGSSRLSLSPV
jgi:hypothetical protein